MAVEMAGIVVFERMLVKLDARGRCREKAGDGVLFEMKNVCGE